MSGVNFSVIIPARYGATRLPGKPLIDLLGKPMIQHVYERAQESGAQSVIVATDDERIERAVKGFGGEVCMTASSHHSGTDRITEVAEKKCFTEDHIVVNLQGDEPLMPASVIEQTANNLQQVKQASIATVCVEITTVAELFDSNIVKVVRDHNDMAIYFSRAVIPWDREHFASSVEALPERSMHYRHVGIYAYRVGFLRQFTAWPSCTLEELESLEQLRAIWHGHKIHVSEAVETPLAGIDTEKDLDIVRRYLSDL